MQSTFGRISPIARRWAVAFVAAGIAAAVHASAQQAQVTSSTPATFSGCVQKSSGERPVLILNAPNACAVLEGKAARAELAGHEVQLTGILVPRTASAPTTIRVSAITERGAVCSSTCVPEPPGTRGLHRPSDHEIPGSEGGTPGESKH